MTTALASVGTKLEFSLDGVHYTTVAQVRKLTPQGSKQTFVDQTNILTPGNGDAPLPVRFSSGEMQMDGVLAPQDSSQLTLGQMHAALTVAFWRARFSDGVTVWVWQGSVSNYVPFDFSVMKAGAFSATIRITGAYTGPMGTA
jgi:Lambda phage tail tube protein, TTP